MPESNLMPIGIFHQHFTYIPLHTFGSRKDLSAFGFYPVVVFIYVVNKYRKPGARAPLPFFAKKYFHAIFAYPAECWRILPTPFVFKLQYFRIVGKADCYISGIKNGYRFIKFHLSNLQYLVTSFARVSADQYALLSSRNFSLPVVIKKNCATKQLHLYLQPNSC